MDKKEWKAALEPFAMVFAGMVENIKGMDNDELLELRTACDQPTSTNCWCWIYTVANVIRGEVDSEIRQRRLTPNSHIDEHS